MDPKPEFFPERNFLNVCGGLRTEIRPNPKVKNLQLRVKTLDDEDHCSMFHEYETLHWELEETRRHHRLHNGSYLEYFPCFYGQPKFHHKVTHYEWNIHINQYRPDYKYLSDFNKAVTNQITEMKSNARKGVINQIDNFTLSQGLFNFNWLYPGPKRALCIYIAQYLCCQCELKNIILENGQMRDQDGFRLLLTISLTVGDTLEMLCLWNFFLKGVMPVDIGYKEDMNDPFIMTSDLKKHIPEEEKKRIWCKFIMDDKGGDLPTEEYFYFLTVTLKGLTNITKLYLNYNWLAIGQGIGLNLLGCIRNGNLKDLHLLCTREDMPYISGSRISARAWYKAKQKCPGLKLHLVLMSVGSSYDDNLTVLVDEMPLTSYQLVTGLPVVEYQHLKNNYFDCLIKTIIYKYCQTLRRLYLEVWYPRERVDVMLTRCLTDLPLLESFTYCGTFDKFDTVIEICKYLLNYETKLKFLKLLVQEDPCQPQMYRERCEEILEQYKYRLYDRGIVFHLGTHII